MSYHCISNSDYQCCQINWQLHCSLLYKLLPMITAYSITVLHYSWTKKLDSIKTPAVSWIPRIGHDLMGDVSFNRVPACSTCRIQWDMWPSVVSQCVLILGHESPGKACCAAHKAHFWLMSPSLFCVSLVVGVWERLAKGLGAFWRQFKQQVSAFCFYFFFHFYYSNLHGHFFYKFVHFFFVFLQPSWLNQGQQGRGKGRGRMSPLVMPLLFQFHQGL